MQAMKVLFVCLILFSSGCVGHYWHEIANSANSTPSYHSGYDDKRSYILPEKTIYDLEVKYHYPYLFEFSSSSWSEHSPFYYLVHIPLFIVNSILPIPPYEVVRVINFKISSMPFDEFLHMRNIIETASRKSTTFETGYAKSYRSNLDNNTPLHLSRVDISLVAYRLSPGGNVQAHHGIDTELRHTFDRIKTELSLALSPAASMVYKNAFESEMAG